MKTSLANTKDAQVVQQGHTTSGQFGSDAMAKAQRNDARPLKH